MKYTVFYDNSPAIENVHYKIIESHKIFESICDNLIIDFSDYNDFYFNIWSNNILKCGNNCYIKCTSRNKFYLGEKCLIEDYSRNNIVYECKENCKVKLISESCTNQFFIPTNYTILTNDNKFGFEIIDRDYQFPRSTIFNKYSNFLTLTSSGEVENVLQYY